MNVIAYTAEQLQILRQQNQSLTDEEFAYLVEVSKATGLNLFQRQLHGLNSSCRCPRPGLIARKGSLAICWIRCWRKKEWNFAKCV